MNSFFIQPTIDQKSQTLLSDQIRQSSQKFRIESELWQANDLRKNLHTALEATSPTIIAVGSRHWLDTIITTVQDIRPTEMPTFGSIPYQTSTYNFLTPFVLRRSITPAINALAARKLSHIPVFHVNQYLFTESCSLELKGQSETFLAKFSLQLHSGEITLSTQASRIDISLLEDLHDQTPLLRLSVKSEQLTKQASSLQDSDLLPANRTSLRTNRYEDAVHLPIRKAILTTAQPLTSSSHPEIAPTSPLTISPASFTLKFITSKNQPQRY